jgi:signal transduction histidine kinase
MPSLSATYDPLLVVGSLVVATFAAYTALTLTGRVSSAGERRTRTVWLATGALAMGVGIWGMHFIGMLALRLPIPIAYDVPEVLASIAVACVASWLALTVAASAALRARRLAVAGAALGAAISGMHYTGMAAVRLSGYIQYDGWRVAASIAVAMVVALAALWIAFQFRDDAANAKRSVASLRKWGAATLMGFAVAGMHYTAMSAAHFHASLTADRTDRYQLADAGMATLVGIAAALVLGATLTAALIDRGRRKRLAVDAARRERETQLESAVAERTAHLAAAEARFRQLSDATTDGIAITRDGVVLETNRAWRRMFAVAPEPGQSPGVVVDLVAPEDREVVRGLLANPPDSESEVHCVGGNQTQFLGSLTINDATWNGARAQILVIRDISAIRRIEQLKNELVSTVSHELRTPLTSIRGALGLIEHGVDGQLSPSLLSLVRIGRSNCDRLIRLINDLLDLDKISVGRLELHMESLAMADVIQTTLDELQPMAVEYGVSIRPRVAPDLPRVQGDRDRLSQVLINLVANAIKFTPRGSTVVVRAVTVPASPDGLRIAVENPGPGIAAEDITRLFRPFQQLDASDNRARGGTGLGLAIAKALIQRHGGSIGVESEPDVLTTFWFELPAAGSTMSFSTDRGTAVVP